jgi:hypothetical protein
MNDAAVTEQDGGSARLPSLQRDARLLHVPEHVLRLRGAPTLKAITIGCISAAVETQQGLTKADLSERLSSGRCQDFEGDWLGEFSVRVDREQRVGDCLFERGLLIAEEPAKR